MGDNPETVDEVTDDADEVGSLTFGQLRSLIKGVLGETNKDTEARRVGRRAVETRLDRDSMAEDQIEKAVKRLKDEEDRKIKEAALEGRLKTVEERTADRPPVERSKLHKFMGWGD